MFGRATITLGIGPHSSSSSFLCIVLFCSLFHYFSVTYRAARAVLLSAFSVNMYHSHTTVHLMSTIQHSRQLCVKQKYCRSQYF